jgi:hypothetical protein
MLVFHSAPERSAFGDQDIRPNEPFVAEVILRRVVALTIAFVAARKFGTWRGSTSWTLASGPGRLQRRLPSASRVGLVEAATSDSSEISSSIETRADQSLRQSGQLQGRPTG